VTELIRLSGIEAEGHHGAVEGERDQPQLFVIDLEVHVDAEADDLGSTADYRDIVAAVREVVAEESHALIETLARTVAGRVAADPGVVSCRAVVHKPAAAARLGITDVSAEATAPEREATLQEAGATAPDDAKP
jgi:dihydroneopterin aldolase/2-amino-4-hydroxy-6-hydroxymethyldihydropteridine diphosphokinase